MKAPLARFLREPLVIFLCAGAALFAVDAALARRSARVIVLTKAQRADLTRELEAEKGRPPSAAELGDAIARWKRDEALYREGLRHGLDQGDPQVRARVAGKLREIFERNALSPEPTEADLEAFLAAHRAYYEVVGAGGALPPREQLHPRLVADFKEAQRRQAVEQATVELLGRYRVEEER